MAKGKKNKYEVGFDDYEEREGSGYDGDEPKKGTYEGALVSLKEHTSAAGNEGLEWQFEITEEPYVGWRGWSYSNMDTAKWKTQQFTTAIAGGSKEKFVLQPAADGEDGRESATVKKAKPVRLVIRREKNPDDESVGRIRQVLPSEAAKAKKKKKDDDPV